LHSSCGDTPAPSPPDRPPSAGGMGPGSGPARALKGRGELRDKPPTHGAPGNAPPGAPWPPAPEGRCSRSAGNSAPSRNEPLRRRRFPGGCPVAVRGAGNCANDHVGPLDGDAPLGAGRAPQGRGELRAQPQRRRTRQRRPGGSPASRPGGAMLQGCGELRAQPQRTVATATMPRGLPGYRRGAGNCASNHVGPLDGDAPLGAGRAPQGRGELRAQLQRRRTRQWWPGGSPASRPGGAMLQECGELRAQPQRTVATATMPRGLPGCRRGAGNCASNHVEPLDGDAPLGAGRAPRGRGELREQPRRRRTRQRRLGGTPKPQKGATRYGEPRARQRAEGRSSRSGRRRKTALSRPLTCS